ncbi:hypothetical protein CEXT_579101 [Caerostris extrusa]|uniref:Uncharacterized protein n=1 Tax=Caerostris extrusa TaxID=172846 RepID=A0AAV4NM06_CAEEX|nr:hypothetical protein CEXT_579101 [Caerostris extrusa]
MVWCQTRLRYVVKTMVWCRPDNGMVSTKRWYGVNKTVVWYQQNDGMVSTRLWNGINKIMVWCQQRI